MTIISVSGVWAGATTIETAWNCQEVLASNGWKRQTIKEELQRIGYFGNVPASYKAQPIAAHFELHIEQGPILQDEARKIGLVTGGQAFQWFEVEVRGKDSHAGTTPPSARKDAIFAAAKTIVASNEIAKDAGGLVTTGVFQVEPGSFNTVAHTVRFTLGVRHPSDQILSEMIDQCRRVFSEIAEEHCVGGKDIQLKRTAGNSAVEWDQDCISVVEQSAEQVCNQLVSSKGPGVKLWKQLVSGAGHDSCQVSRK